MKQILGITGDSKQKRSIVLDDGTRFTFTMYFSPLQQGWFIRELTYGDFAMLTMRISNQPNMLYQFKNQIPFGLACASKDDREPSLQQDFLSGASKLYVLSEAEVQAYSDFLSDG